MLSPRAALLSLPLLLTFVPGAVLAPPTPLATGDAPALTVALDGVSSADLSADVYFLASDELEGRDSPSRGQRIAARYIRSRLQHLGWEPGAGDSYLHEYSLDKRKLDGARTGLRFTAGSQEVALAYGAEYVFHPRDLWSGAVEGELVFVGKGDRASFEGAECEGRWALCVESDVSWRDRVRNAKAAGACGVLVTRAEGDATSYSERYDSWVASAIEGSFEDEVEPGFPTVYVDRPAVDRVLALVGAGANPAPGLRTGVEVVEERHSAISESVPLENVCGFWPGSDPELSREVLIVSAHYDHVGVRADGDVYNGADDNASGTSVLLAIAEALERYGPLRRSVLLIWVSAEEKGLLGSRAWTKAPTLREGHRAVADLNIDMVGRNAPDQLLITPTESHPAYNGLVALAQEVAPLEGFPKLGSCDDYWNRSDHANFHDNLKIPVAFLFSDVHEDYHRTSDTPEKIDYDKMRRVTRLVVRMLVELSGDELDPSNEWRPRAR